VLQEISVQCYRRNGLPKLAYRSQAKARQAIVQQKPTATAPLYQYQCPRCGLWHLTSAPQRKPAEHRSAAA